MACVHEPTGPHGWPPLLYACFSRLLRADPARASGIREVVRRLLDAGARVDGDPAGQADGPAVPLGQACWRGRVAVARELVERGAALSFPDGGSAIGAALHGARRCHDPEVGPTMQTICNGAGETATEGPEGAGYGGLT